MGELKLFKGELVIPVELELYDYLSRSEIYNQFRQYAQTMIENGDTPESIMNADVRMFNIDRERE